MANANKSGIIMKYICETCGEEYGRKVNAHNHAKRTGHINFEKIEENRQTSLPEND